jgi:hypothetical protein
VNARYAPGSMVRVSTREPAGHVRTPRYIRGKVGTVERICGTFRSPEELAYGRRDGAARPLYRVRFAQRAVWPDYRGAPSDTIDVEIFEHWLEPVTEAR